MELRGPSCRRAAAACACLLALAAAVFSVVRPTNFRGFDEWLILSLVSQGILDFPYANRPLNLAWWLPAQLAFPGSLAGFLVLHAAWIGLTGAVVFLLARRLFPRAASLAFLAGAFAIAWAPGDRTRLCATQMLLYSGCTFGAVLAAHLAAEGWARRRPALAALATLPGGLAVLSFEAALAPLALVPLLFAWLGGRREPRRLALWTAAWLLLVAAGAVRAALPAWTAPERVHYQTQLAPETRPLPLATRALRKLHRHVAPVASVPPWSASAAVPAALAVFGLGLGLASARRSASSRVGGPRALAGRRRADTLAAAGFGFLWAFASYVPFVASPAAHGVERMQFLSAPGVALLLGAAATAAASLLRSGRARWVATLLLGGWVVAGGVLRTVALQHEWDERSAFAGQRRALASLATVAPDLRPGTLVVLLDGGEWPLDVTFRHAVKYVYEGRAAGHDVRALEFLYETRFEEAGVRSLPAAVVRQPWREPPVLYPYDALVVVRAGAEGRMSLVESWPADLPPLPPGASYGPRARILAGPLPRRLLVLGR